MNPPHRSELPGDPPVVVPEPDSSSHSMDVPSAEGVRNLGLLGAIIMGAILLAFVAWWAMTPGGAP
jgi:hypothetical protein